MRISDWSSDVCSSDLRGPGIPHAHREQTGQPAAERTIDQAHNEQRGGQPDEDQRPAFRRQRRPEQETDQDRSEEHTSELQSLMRISYAVFCLKKKKKKHKYNRHLTSIFTTYNRM